MQEPEISLRRVSTSALSDIAKHTPELAQHVVDAGALPFLAGMVTHDDARLKRQVCSCLAQVAKHSVDLAESVVETEIFPRILACLRDADLYVRKNSATCIREIVKHSDELAKLVVNAGGSEALVDFVMNNRGNVRLPGIMAIGYICAFSETLAMTVQMADGVIALKDALSHEPEDHVKAATVWTLSQIGRHSPTLARYLSDAGVLQPMVVLHVREDSSPDLRTKAKRALKAVLVNCTDGAALSPLLKDANPKIQQYVLQQYAAILPNDRAARAAFLKTGLLARVQQIKRSATGKVVEAIEKINAVFPPDAVKFSDPAYSVELIRKIEEDDVMPPAGVGSGIAAAGGGGR